MNAAQQTHDLDLSYSQVIPVALAIMSSFLSAILILGTPAELYTHGTMYWLYLFGMCGAAVLATVFFVPLLYRLKLTSSYEVRKIIKTHSRLWGWGWGWGGGGGVFQV